MIEALIITWLIIGAATSILAAQEARRKGVSVHWVWWPIFTVLGPISIALAAVVALLAPRMRK